MTPSIVVGGEALVDLVAGGGGELDAHLGGGPFNCARTLGRLEQPVAYLGRLSNDRFGTQLREQLEEDGVSLDMVVETDDPTTLALAELDEEGAATYRFYSGGTSVPGLTPEAALATLPPSVEMVHVGTLGLVFEPIADALEAVVEHATGALVMVDLNIRPLAIPDAASYRARIDRLLPRTHVVKASDDDLAWLDPERDPSRRRARCSTTGPAVVLLTRGGEGVTVVTADGETDVPALQVEVVDTIGAGDAFGGGFLAWWRRAGLGAEDLGADRRGARGHALRLRGRGPDGRARGGVAAAARRDVAPRLMRYGVTIGLTLCGSSRLGAQRGVDLVEREVTGDDRLEVDGAGGGERDRRRVGVGVAERAGQPDLARLDQAQRDARVVVAAHADEHRGAGRAQRGDAVVHRLRVAGALDQHVGLRRLLAGLQRARRARPQRQLQPVPVDVGHRDLRRAPARARPGRSAARSARRR